MAQFFVSGPFKVALKKHATGAISIDENSLQEVIEQCPEFEKTGCYVFAIDAPKGATPIYVGRSTKQSLKKEAFNSRNQKAIFGKLNERTRHNKLIIYLVTQKRSRGKPNLSEIEEIEEFLIANAAVKAPDLLNKKGVVKQKWSILGVHNSAPGKPDAAAKSFKRDLGIRKR